MSPNEKWIISGIIFSFWASLCAHILILPPYEGFDENAHYSYISFLSDRNKIPKLNESFLDKNIENVWLVLPKPYNSVPPFERNSGMTYHYFYDVFLKSMRETALKAYWNSDGSIREYFPSQTPNWLGQHPPLYYILMGVPYRLSRQWSPGMQLLFLRAITSLIVLGGLFFWVKAVYLVPSTHRQNLLFGGLCMLFFPSLFFDLGRLGNDALVALFASGVFYYMIDIYFKLPNQRLSSWVKLAVVMGCGLLTKLFFLPMAVGAIGYYTWVWHLQGQNFDRNFLKHLAAYILILFVLSGWWFILSYHRYGMIFVSEEIFQFGTVEEPFNGGLSFFPFVGQMARSSASFGLSFLWSGSWSWLRPPLGHYLFWLPLVSLTLCGFYVSVKERRQVNLISVIGLFLFIPLLLGFIYHMYMRVRFTGLGTGTGGYYFFIIWPVLGCFVAYCFQNNFNFSLRILVLMAFGCLVVFEVIGEWRLIQLYAGVLVKAGKEKAGIGGIALSFESLLLVLKRLEFLVFPYVAVGFYLAALTTKSVLVGLICYGVKGNAQRLRT